MDTLRGPRVRRLFPGGNTAYGFYSLYDQIIAPDAARILIVKGGPGVGKSSFMGAIAEEMVRRGFAADHAVLLGQRLPGRRGLPGNKGGHDRTGRPRRGRLLIKKKPAIRWMAGDGSSVRVDPRSTGGAGEEMFGAVV